MPVRELVEEGNLLAAGQRGQGKSDDSAHMEEETRLHCHPHPIRTPLSPEGRAAFRRALYALTSRSIPFSVGGALAVEWYSGVWRKLNDLDLYLVPAQTPAAMEALTAFGFRTEIKHPEWLAQGFWGEWKVDLVYGAGNWLEAVDEMWITAGQQGEILGERVRVAPIEELIWSKAFLGSRERNDAADVYHLLEAVDCQLDWARLLQRFGDHWEVLLGHLVFFRYVYPSSRHNVPDWVMDELNARLRQTRERTWSDGKLCRGPLLDGAGSYALDIEEHGFRDARAEVWLERANRGDFPPQPLREREADS